jgi:hypothetical protein
VGKAAGVAAQTVNRKLAAIAAFGKTGSPKTKSCLATRP